MDMHEAKRVWQRELRQLRRDMRAAGIKVVSCLNGGLDGETYRYNVRRFQLETWIKGVK